MTEQSNWVYVNDFARIASGSSGHVVVRLINHTTEPCDFLVSAVGLDPAWLSTPTMCGPVGPGSEVETVLEVRVPAGSPSGTFPFLVSAQPTHTMTGAPLGPVQEADAGIVVGDASRLLLRTDPPEPAGVTGRGFAVVVDNRTPENLQVTLDVQPTKGLYLRLRRDRVEVPAGEVRRVRARGSVQRRLTGTPRRLPFVITAQGHTTPARLDAIFVARPLFSTALTRVVAVLALISVWATIAFLALGAVSRHAHKQSVATLSAGEGGGAGSGGAGGRSGGSGSGSGGSGAGAAGGGSSSLSGSGRINGVVTGPAPGGVKVTLQPTSLVDESAEAGGSGATSTSVGKLTNVAYELPTAVSPKRSTTTQSSGLWAFAGVNGPGYYLLTFSKPGYQTVRQVITKDAAAQQPLSVQLVAGKGRLAGTVTGPAGRVPGATVTLTDGTVTITTSTPTKGAVGTWSVGGLSTPGTYLVSASAPGMGLSSRLVSLAAGGTGTGVDVALQRGVASLVGHVSQVDETGTVGDAGGVTVTVTDGTTKRTATTLTPTGGSAGTGPGLVGTYTIPDLPLGDYDVTFSKNGFGATTQKVSLTAASSSARADGQLVSSGAVVTGQVLDKDGNGIPTAGIVLTGDAGTYKSTTDNSGVFRLSGVAAGSYVLSAEKFAKVTQFAAVKAVAGTPGTPIVLTLPDIPGGLLPPTSHIRGRVVDARTGGILTCAATVDPADCGVTVKTVDHRDDGDHSFTVFAKPDAEYVLPPADQSNPQGLEPGLHLVSYSAHGYEPSTINVQVPLGGFAEAPQVALFPQAGLTGTVNSGVPDTLPTGTCVIAVPFDGTAPAAPPCTPPVAGFQCPAPTGGGCTMVDPSNGDWSMPDLSHGTYTVYIIPTNDEWIPVSPTQVTLTLGEIKRYDVTLNRFGRIHVFARIPSGSGALAAPSGQVDITVTGGPSTPPTQHIPAGSDGVTITGLKNGSYNLHLTATEGSKSYVGDVTGVAVSQNQTADSTAVMTTTASALIGRVVYKVNNTVNPVVGAAVTVIGTTSFTGTTPKPTTFHLVTDADGCFAITPSGAAPPDGNAAYPDCHFGTTTGVITGTFAAPDVSITAGATGFPASVTVAGTANAEAGVIELQPATRTFVGHLTIDGAAPPASVDLSKASIVVTTSATGAGTVVISSTKGGTLSWHDDNYQQANIVRPGLYEVRASLPGYDDGTAELDCPADLTGTAGSCDLEISVGSHVGLTVNIWGDSAHTVPVLGAVVTLSGDKLPAVTVTAGAGSNSVNFPDLSAGGGKVSYTVEIHAAGYTHLVDSGLKFTAGATPPPLDEVLSPLGTISGTISGSAAGAATPLGGAIVTVHSGTQTFTATSASDGSYAVTGTTSTDGLALDKTWTVTASAPGYSASSGVSVTFPAATTTLTQDITLTARSVDAVLHVADDLGQDINNATVSITPTTGGSAISGTHSSSDADGDYHFCGATGCLAPTTYSLQVSAPNHAPLSTTVTLQVNIATQNLSVVLAGRHNGIAVHVLGQTGTATPTVLSGATVTVASGSTTVATGTTDSNGDYQTGNLDDDTYTVTISDTGYGDVTRSLVLANGQLAAIEATLQQQLGQLTVTVASSTGDSMAGAMVALVARGSGAVSQSAQEADGTTTVSTTFNGVVPGDYRITTAGPGAHLPGAVDVTVGSGTQSQTVTVAETRLALKVATSDASGTTASVTVTPSGATGPSITESFLTDVATAQDIYVPAGTAYTVAASATGYATASQNVPSAGTASVNLTLTKTVTHTLTVNVTGPGSSGATISLSGIAQTATANGSGTATITGLAPATYTVLMTPSGGGTPQSKTADLTAGNATVSFTIAAPAALNVTLTTAGGGTLSGATVTVSNGTTSTTATTNNSGVASFTGLAMGSYSVSATTVDGGAGASNITLNSAGPTPLSVPITYTGSLTVRVRNSSNAAVSGTVSISGNGITTQTQSGSDVTFTGLAPGTYNVTVVSGSPAATTNGTGVVIGGGSAETTISV